MTQKQNQKQPTSLKLAFLGTGGIASRHARAAAESGVEVVGACDVREQAVRKFLEKNFDAEKASVPAFTDAERMYEQTRPDAVVICTPHTLHFEHCMQAIERGCHVLVEKPMVTSSQDAYKLRDRVRETGKVLVVGFNTPCSKELFYVREVIRTGKLGRLELISGYLSQGWKQAVGGSWRTDPSLSGGGQAYDSGAHLLTSVCWSVESRVKQVGAFIDQLDTPVDINSAINVRFENGVLAALSISGNCNAAGAGLHFMFEKGRIDMDGWNASWIKVHDPSDALKQMPMTESMNAGSPFENFLHAIEGKAEARTSVENGVIHSELMDAIYASAESGRIVGQTPA